MSLPQYAQRILLASILILTGGCRPEAGTYTFRSTPVDGWERGDTLTFPIDTLRREGLYHLDLCIRTSSSQPYPFRSLWLEIRRQGNAPSLCHTDTLVCHLVDPKGDPQGRGVAILQYDFPLDTLYLPAGSCGTVSVRHVMSRDLLPGIVNVGIRLLP